MSNTITIVNVGDRTPWGRADHVYKLGEGIYSASTSSHGGMHLAPAINALIPKYMRADNGWYEEDCQQAIPPFVLGCKYFDCQRTHQFIEEGEAEQTVKVWYWKEWERYTGKILQPGESSLKDEAEYLEAHAQDWLVISALGACSYHNIPDGFIKAWATIGGSRSPHSIQKAFLIPKEEYEKRTPMLYFLVDPSKYQEVSTKEGV
jgi:hypothetical protein